MSGSKKISVSLPEELVDEVQARAGRGSISGFIAAAVQHQIAMQKLDEIVDDYESRHDELDESKVEAVRAILRRDHRNSGGAAA